MNLSSTPPPFTIITTHHHYESFFLICFSINVFIDLSITQLPSYQLIHVVASGVCITDVYFPDFYWEELIGKKTVNDFFFQIGSRN